MKLTEDDLIQTQKSNRLKSRLKLTFKLLITFGLLYYVIAYVKIDEILAVLKNADYFYLILALFFMPVNIFIQFLKWQLACNYILGINDNSKIWKSLFLGFSAGLVTPIRIGEYFGRKIPFEDFSLLKVSIATMIEKMTLLITVLVIGGFAAMYFLIKFYSFIYVIPILVLIVLVFIAVLFVIFKYKLVVKFLTSLETKFNFVKTLNLELRYTKKISIKSIGHLFIYSLFLLLIVSIQYSFLAMAFAQNGSFLNFFITGIIVVFIKAFIAFISFADLGVRESSSVFLLEKFGYNSAVGFNSAIFLFILNLLLPALIGLFMMLKGEKK
jgi:uncharacterized membrane protein YbhN (UPF0104 family)